MSPNELQYNIADWAIAGNKINEVGDCLWYMNPFNPKCPDTFPYNGSGSFFTRINNHCFYEPTQLYANT